MWNGFLLEKVRNSRVPCRFCGAPDHDGHLFWECTFPPLVEIRENPEFHDLIRMDKGHWPRCLLWHGWLSMLSGVNGAFPWAAGASEGVGYLVDAALGCYSSGMITEWSHPDEYDRVVVASLVPGHPNVWSDGSAVLDQVTGVSFVELLILYELWAGERLSLEKAQPRYLRLGRPISVSAVPFGPGIDIWRSCRFIGAMMRSLCLLPGGLRFVPCSIDANHCGLRHIGWEKCGRGLTSRPRESASEPFFE